MDKIWILFVRRANCEWQYAASYYSGRTMGKVLEDGLQRGGFVEWHVVVAENYASFDYGAKLHSLNMGRTKGE